MERGADLWLNEILAPSQFPRIRGFRTPRRRTGTVN